MKELKNLPSALVLTLSLTVSAFAGIMDTPAPPPAAASSATTPGDIWIPGDGHGPGSPSESAAVVALNLLKDLLLVF